MNCKILFISIVYLNATNTVTLNYLIYVVYVLLITDWIKYDEMNNEYLKARSLACQSLNHAVTCAFLYFGVLSLST